MDEKVEEQSRSGPVRVYGFRHKAAALWVLLTEVVCHEGLFTDLGASSVETMRGNSKDLLSNGEVVAWRYCVKLRAWSSSSGSSDPDASKPGG